METIVALATPPLQSALALIRVSGDEALSITEKLSGLSLPRNEKPYLRHATLTLDGKSIDDVVLLCYPSPRSMTGEDVVEITCHGSPLIAEEIIDAYRSLGARNAVNGEFTSRAFYNGKLDLVQAEAVNDLIKAVTRESKNVALLSLKGETSRLLEPLLTSLGEAIGKIEVGIDFPEYDEEEDFTVQDIVKIVNKTKEDLRVLINQGDESRYLRSGVDVALVGEPNVGKSSLLNAILSEDKAIVSATPGTTRDVVEGTISIHGLPVRLYDTAGIHDTADEIERLGVERSKRVLEKAELVLLVLDAQKPEGPETNALRQMLLGKRVIEIHNKSDRIKERTEGICYASAAKGETEEVKKAIFDALSLSKDVYVTPALSSPRELALLKRIDRYLDEVLAGAKRGDGVDLIAVPLQQAYNAMRQVLGLDATQDFSNEIFSRFCVGK